MLLWRGVGWPLQHYYVIPHGQHWTIETLAGGVLLHWTSPVSFFGPPGLTPELALQALAGNRSVYLSFKSHRCGWEQWCWTHVPVESSSQASPAGLFEPPGTPRPFCNWDSRACLTAWAGQCSGTMPWGQHIEDPAHVESPLWLCMWQQIMRLGGACSCGSTLILFLWDTGTRFIHACSCQ